MSDELPQGWAAAPIDKLCGRYRGVSYAREEASPRPLKGTLPILRANNIEDDQLVFDDLVYVPTSRISQAQHIRKGDVVIAMSSGSKSVVGKTAQASQDWNGAFGAFCGLLRPSPEIAARYFGLFLRTQDYRQRISELAAGTNINNLKAEHFSAIDIPLAPLPEQRRIVATLDALLAKVDASQRRLVKVSVLLERFRQSVLAAACSGRLTADWREEDQTLEPPSRVGEGDPPENLETPDSWSWMISAHAFDFVTSGSRGWARYYADEGPLFLRVGNLDHDSIQLDLTSIQHVRPPGNAEGKRTRVQPGDLLISITADVGMVALVDRDIGEAYINQHVALARPNGNLDRRYLAYFLAAANGGQHQFLSLQRGATKVGLGLDDIKSIWIARPPLPEQQEIVRRVEALFALADQLEARLAQARAQVEKLTPALLAKAFRGELVPQDPNDEPASALLERIKSAAVDGPPRKAPRPAHLEAS